MTDQLAPPDPAFPPPSPQSRMDKFRGEIVAGGAADEVADDELADGWRGKLAMVALAGLFIWLLTINVWWFVFVVGILICVFLHEGGHFITAKLTGMKVTQFFMFMGPRLWSFRRGETEYGVRLIPVGAFVRIVGMHKMDPDVPAEDEARTYRQKSFPRRLLVISGGSLMHMIIAIVLLFIVYVGPGERTTDFKEEVVVAEATFGGPADNAGILAGDQLLSVSGRPIADASELGDVIRSFEPGDVVDVVLIRDGAEVTIPVGLGARVDVPENDEFFGTAVIGIDQGSPYRVLHHSVPAAALNAVTDIVPTAWESATGVVKALNPVNLWSHVNGTNDDLATRPVSLIGVTGVSDDIGDQQGIFGVLSLLALFNVFVGVFNMFPLLPLDGGHAAIAIYERVREGIRGGKQRYFADVERLMPFAMAVVMFLVVFMFASMYLDIAKPI